MTVALPILLIGDDAPPTSLSSFLWVFMVRAHVFRAVPTWAQFRLVAVFDVGADIKRALDASAANIDRDSVEGYTRSHAAP